jgi:hypothetical protein
MNDVVAVVVADERRDEKVDLKWSKVVIVGQVTVKHVSSSELETLIDHFDRHFTWSFFN